jgi:hypothetical protein
MSPQVVKTIEHPAGDRRVEIYQRDNGTFGFDELVYGTQERAWYPTGQYSFAIIDTAERAEQEARGRVPWLSPD